MLRGNSTNNYNNIELMSTITSKLKKENKNMVRNNDEFVFKLSKSKAIYIMTYFTIIFVGSILAIGAGLHRSGFNRLFLIIVPFPVFILTGLGIISGFKKIINDEFDLIINKEGIVNGELFIRWTDITGIKVIGARHSFLLIFVKNPEDYFDLSRGFYRFFTKMDLKFNKAIRLNANWLELDIDELAVVIKEKLNKRPDRQPINPHKNLLQNTELEKIKKALAKLQSGDFEFDSIGIHSNNYDCIYFTYEKGKFNLEFEAFNASHLPYIDQLKDFAKAYNFKYSMKTYDTKTKYQSDKPTPVLRIETNASIDEMTNLAEHIQTEIFNNNMDTKFEVVP